MTISSEGTAANVGNEYDASRAGATALINDGLRLSSGDLLFIICQEEYRPAADCIADVARILGVNARILGFRRDEFLNGYKPSFGPDFIRADAPRGIVVLMEWSPETTSARLDLLQNLGHSGQNWRVASMPGVDVQNLALCDGSIANLATSCRLVFAALARARTATLHTPNPSGNIDSLVVQLDSIPIISSGQIEDGTWGNFPSGETFIVPTPKRSSGWITIRGSLPRTPLAAGEWIRFRVSDGKIVADSLAAQTRQDESHDWGQVRHGRNRAQGFGRWHQQRGAPRGKRCPASQAQIASVAGLPKDVKLQRL